MRTVIVSDSLAFSLLAVRPEGMWDIDWADQRNKNIMSPEYGLLYVASYLQKTGTPFEVVNIVGDSDASPAFLRDVASRALIDTDAKAQLDDWVERRWQAVLDDLEARRPDVVMVSLMYYFMVVYVKQLLGDVRARLPEAKIVVGGNYATLHADEVVQEGIVDYVVCGEGEHTAHELLAALDGKMPIAEVDGLAWLGADGSVVRTSNRARENDLDSFPHLYTVGEQFRIRHRHDILCELIPYGDYWPGTGLITARGCPERCSFCLDPAIWQRSVRFHSAEYVADAVRFCQENYPSEHNRFFFGDSTFTLRWRRLEPMLRMLGELGMSYTCQTRADALDEKRVELMAESGWATVGIGAESLDPEILDRVALKREEPSEIVSAAELCRKYGIQPVLTLIAGFPGDTRPQLLATCDELRRLGLHISSFFPLVVFRGTGLYEGFDDVEGFSGSRFFADRDRTARLNEWSEEWVRLSEEFPTKDELIDFTMELNKRVRLPLDETDDESAVAAS